MRNTIIELSFFSDEKLNTLDKKLNQRFGIKFQGPFEILEFLIVGYIVYSILTDLRFQGFQIDQGSLQQLIYLSVIVISMIIGDAILVVKDFHIYKFVKRTVDLSRKNSN
ncbi:hypothetical protein [Companilactobacillus futsaii]|nr:hypothetical protein [Companilactobacillus futsaii]